MIVPGADDGALLDHGAFVDPGVAADEHFVLDDHRQRPDRLDDAADLRAGADVHARADLRARADEHVRVDQRALVHVGADVHVHRRHADHAAPDERAFAHRRSARHQPHLAIDADRLERHRVLVEERPSPMIHRVIDEAAEPEPEQDALFDPGVDAPAGGLRRVGLGGAQAAIAEAVAQPHEGAARGERVGLVTLFEQVLDLVRQLLFGHG